MMTVADELARDCEFQALVGPVGKYPHLEYSKHDIRRAGERLSGALFWDGTDREEIIRTFAIASNWRDSHVYPMRSLRMSLIQRMRKLSVGGFSASRPKTMASIRRKLRIQKTMKLDQINDLGGCRIVTDDIAGMWAIVTECMEGFPHPVRGRPYDYVRVAKPDGYRSYHVVFDFHAKPHDLSFDGRRVELQVRTWLQHSWATAVEAVGLFRSENLKGGEGDPDWLRLFKLMSDEFALAERCEEGLTVSRRERLLEIRDLNARIGALDLLENTRNVTRYVTEYVLAEDAKYYLIAYDRETNEVKVTPYGDAILSSMALDKAERESDWREGGSQKVVLVEMDQIALLVDAYPNYFGDVLLFSRRLQDLCNSRTEDYHLKPQAIAPAKPKERPDMSWMNHPKWRRWTEKR